MHGLYTYANIIPAMLKGGHSGNRLSLMGLVTGVLGALPLPKYQP